ncbi:MAG TPA: alpha/beta hydrolase [Bacteroidales bacterium]|nr:alpha/beta hydrolase [Bacteroidales bacterium]
MKKTLLIPFLLTTMTMSAQQIIPLYAGEIPNSKPGHMKELQASQNGVITGYAKVSNPTLTIFLPEHPTGTAVIICPGGGYIGETYKGEGTDIAGAFIKQGIAAFVLKYRLPSDSIMIDKSVGPLQDAQQAIKIVREHAADWKIKPNRIGIMGFSAGGHLASTAGTHFNKAYIPDSLNTSLRPDFMILCYPVISTDPEIAHMGSRTNLLGPDPGEEKLKLFSNELQVNKDTPPVWITHSGDDPAVPVENSIRFYQALIRNGIPVEMHLVTAGDHAFILRLNPDEWMIPIFNWIKKLQ